RREDLQLVQLGLDDEADRRQRQPADLEFRLLAGWPRRHRRRAADVSVADLRVAAWLQPRRHGRQQASHPGNRRLPQRAIPMSNPVIAFALLNRRLSRKLRRFARDKRGISAVEFAMLLPLMVTLYLGGVEVSQAVAIDRKVTLIARTVADLVAQVT